MRGALLSFEIMQIRKRSTACPERKSNGPTGFGGGRGGWEFDVKLDRGEIWSNRFLESFLELHVPEAAFDRGKRFVVAVLIGGRHKRRVFVEPVLHTKRNGHVIKPPLPVAAAILSRGYWHDVFLLAVVHLHVLTTILGKAGHFCLCRRCQVKRVVQDQIKRSPRRHFAR